MNELTEFLRILDEARAEIGLAESVFSTRISDSPDTIRKARTNNALPKPGRLGTIADRLGLTVDQLLGRAPGPAEPPRVIEATPASVGDVSRAFRGGGGGLPVRGTALGHDIKFDGAGNAPVEVTEFMPAEVLHYVARPPALLGNNDAYAFYVQGDSMAPAHKPGVLRVANPRVGVSIHDDVVVHLTAPIDDGEGGSEIVSILIKTLVKRSASFIELEQLNPPLRFKVPRERIAAIHRVVDLADLLG